MSESGRGELHQFPNPAAAEDQPTAAEQALEAAESRLNQALDQLDQQPEHRDYIRVDELLHGAERDYDNAWKEFVMTPEGKYYSGSLKRHKNAKEYYELTRQKVAGTYHFQDHIAAEGHRANSEQAMTVAQEQAAANPEYYQTVDYQQVNQQHQSILARCKQAWHDLGYIHEGKYYRQAKAKLDEAEEELNLAWSRGEQTPQGQKLAQMKEHRDQLKQDHRQAEEAYKQTPAHAEWAEADKAHRLAELARQREAGTPERAKIRLIEDLPKKEEPTRKLPMAA